MSSSVSEILIKASREMIENLDRQIENRDLGNPFFSSKNYIPHPFSRNNFKGIKRKATDRTIAFLDGGNREILAAPNFSVQVNRVCFNLFKGGERIRPRSIPRRVEFLSATYSKFRDEEIHYHTMIFSLSDRFVPFLPVEGDLCFSSVDGSLTEGHMRADISRVASISRRFAEWSFSIQVMEEELEEGDVLVRDGTLQVPITNEPKYAKKAYRVAEQTKVIFTGFAKRSSLYTSSGLSLLGAVRKLAERHRIPYSSWFYHPIVECRGPDHNAEMFLLKLNPDSERIFRYEIYKKQARQLNNQQLDEIFGGLAENATDIGFPGYPYGLMEADFHARIRSREMPRYRMTALSEISRQEKWDKFASHMEASDAHNVLNRMVG